MYKSKVREITAKTVDEAIEVAMHDLDAARDELEIEVVNPGKAGFLGIGSELSRVRVRKLDPGEDAGSKTIEAVSEILEYMNVSATAILTSAYDPETGGPQVNIEGEDSGLLIGRRGETLRALQFVVALMVNKERDKTVRVSIDVEGYRDRRQRSLSELARRVADKVNSTGRSISLEPMPAAERRMVHMALADDSRVTTESNGSGRDRRIAINPQ